MLLRVAFVTCLSALATAQDVGYTLRLRSYGTLPAVVDLVRIDPTTGADLLTSTLTGNTPHHLPHFASYLANSGGRIAAFGKHAYSGSYAVWGEIHPATARFTNLSRPLSSCPNFWHMTGQDGFSVDVSTSKAYAIERCFNGTTLGTAVYELLSDFDSDNPAGGARYIGFVPYVIARLAINSLSEAYVVGPKPPGGVTDLHLHRLDLNTAQSWAIGPTGLQTPSTQISPHVRDLAFDSNDHLWAMVQLYGPPNYQDYYELHRIDTTTGLSTSISTLQVGPNQGVQGLAFLPAPDFAPYCTAKVNSLGCSPSVSAEGYPSVSAPWGFEVRCTNLRSQSNGALVFGLSGRASLPFHGGALCVQPPLVRTELQSSNGSSTPDCSGVWTLDFNTWIHQHVALPAGVTVQAQWIGRDSGFPSPLDWTLSNALEFTLLP